MFEDTKFDLRTLDFRALTPTQWSTLKNQLIEQARQNRNAELRKAAAYAFAGPERLLRAIARAVAPSPGRSGCFERSRVLSRGNAALS
jgi:hypothetical protein